MTSDAYLESAVPASLVGAAWAERRRRAAAFPSSMTGAVVHVQSLWRHSRKSYAEAATFFMTSITLQSVRGFLVELVGILKSSEVALITRLLEVVAASGPLNQMEQFGQKTVTIRHRTFLDTPYDAPWRLGVRLLASNMRTDELCSQPHGHRRHRLEATLRGSWWPSAALGGRGQGCNSQGAERPRQNSTELAGLSRAIHRKRDDVKPSRRFSGSLFRNVVSNNDVAEGELSVLRQVFRGGSSLRWKDGNGSTPECRHNIQGLTH